MTVSWLYESERLASVTGPALRPGGLELTQRAVNLCRIPRGGRVLDIGCGPAATVAYLRENHELNVAGIDPSALLLGRARRSNVSLPLVRGRAEQLPFADRSMAAVFFECSLSLMAEPAVCLAECRRVLARDGRVIIADIYLQGTDQDIHEGTGNGTAKPDCLSGAVSRTRMIDRLEEVGFETLGWEDHSLWLKQLAARMIFSGGSLRQLLAGQCSCQRSRPGYCLMWARKREGTWMS